MADQFILKDKFRKQDFTQVLRGLLVVTRKATTVYSYIGRVNHMMSRGAILDVSSYINNEKKVLEFKAELKDRPTLLCMVSLSL